MMMEQGICQDIRKIHLLGIKKVIETNGEEIEIMKVRHETLPHEA